MLKINPIADTKSEAQSNVSNPSQTIVHAQRTPCLHGANQDITLIRDSSHSDWPEFRGTESVRGGVHVRAANVAQPSPWYWVLQRTQKELWGSRDILRMPSEMV
ncbi:hypothetical protein N431DRAFT_246207 [Stipitochalara longipes BDJ]|nr:hypothetical protein N431DRAFT_246207 [Stipitochalara longipes BDJ]